MNKIMFLTVIVSCLGGCVNYAAIEAAELKEDDAMCRNMGFAPETDGYKQCRFTSYQARANRRAMVDAAYAGRPVLSQPFQFH